MAGQPGGFKNTVGGFAYRTLFRRNSVFITGVLVAAFAFEVAFDAGTKQYYLGLNKGKTFDEVVGKFQE